MRKRILDYVIFTIMVLLLATSGVQVNAKKDNQGAAWPDGPRGSEFSFESAIVMDLSSGLILYDYNSHDKNYPASITKILTSLLCLEHSSLSEIVTFSQDAVYGIESGSSNIGLNVGERLTMEQCLYAILLESANEACLGVAEHIAGTKSGFMDMMNQRVTKLGLEGTHFVNPNGLHDDNHYTTAYDMAVIAREAMKNNSFRKITASKTYYLPKTNKAKERYLRNHHQMINGYSWPQYEYNFCIGGKTGYTERAQSTLVTFAEKDGMDLVCVIMRAATPSAGDRNEYSDTIRLLNFGFENYKKCTLGNQVPTEENPLFTTFSPFFNADETSLYLSDESSIILPKGAEVSEAVRSIMYHNNALIEVGENTIGTVSYEYNGKVVGTTNIIYEKKDTKRIDEFSYETIEKLINQVNQNIEEKKIKEKKEFKFKKIINKKVIKVTGIVLGILLVGFVIFIVLTRKRRGVHYHKRHKKTIESFNSVYGDFKFK